LGQALKDIGVKRKDIIVATKVGRYHVNHPSDLVKGKNPSQWASDSIFDYSRETVVKSVEESLKRLQLDHLDLVQIHDIEYSEDVKQVIHEAVPALAELRKAGLIKAIGITGFPLNVLLYVMNKVQSLPLEQQIDTVLSYCHYTLLDKTLETSGLLGRWENKGVISASPLAMGLLTREGPPDWHPAPNVIKQACRMASATADEIGVDIADVAIEYAIRNPKITTTLIGFKSEDEVDKAIRVALIYAQRQAATQLADVQHIRKPLKNVEGMSWPSGNSEYKNL